jgi:signal transduction histidine kinase
VSSQLDAAAEPVKDELARMRHQVEHYIGEAQQSIWELRSPRLESAALGKMLHDRAARITEGAGVHLDFVTTGKPVPVPPEVERQVLRIAHEAVVNAVRHAQPTIVHMELSYDGDSVHLRVTDDGHGFDADHAHPKGEGHWGLSIMRERAQQIGGSFALASSPDGGTRIDLVAPIAGHS